MPQSKSTRGRPRKPPSSQINVIVSSDLKMTLEAKAKTLGLSLSEFIRYKVLHIVGTEISGVTDDSSFPKTREEWAASAALRLIELADEIKRQGEVFNELELFIKHGGTREQFFAEGRHKLKVTYISDEPPDPLEGLREVVNTKTKT